MEAGVVRVERIGDATLYLADCRDVLADMPDADAVVADPPYAIPHRYGTHVQNDGGTRTLQFAWDGPGVRDMVKSAVSLACQIGRSHFWFCGLSQAAMIEDHMFSAGMTPKPAAWVKECPPPAGKGNWWPSAFELAVYGYRPGAWFGDTDPKRSNVFVADSYRYGQPGKVDHPTQKPLGLIERICKAIVPDGGTCLDPFMGSGTTGVACARLGRKFIGVEIEPKYFDITCRRIEAAQRQGDLIRDVLPRATQEAML